MTREEMLTPAGLARRWNCSLKKLDADRLRGTGCPFVKLSRMVRYRLGDVEAFEEQNIRISTSDPGDRD